MKSRNKRSNLYALLFKPILQDASSYFKLASVNLR